MGPASEAAEKLSTGEGRGLGSSAVHMRVVSKPNTLRSEEEIV